MRVGRKLLRSSNTVADEAVQEDLEWRKMEEWREEMKVLFCKILEGVEENRLVKMVVEKKGGIIFGYHKGWNSGISHCTDRLSCIL